MKKVTLNGSFPMIRAAVMGPVVRALDASGAQLRRAAGSVRHEPQAPVESL